MQNSSVSKFLGTENKHRCTKKMEPINTKKSFLVIFF